MFRKVDRPLDPLVMRDQPPMNPSLNRKYLPDAITEGEIELKRTGPNN
jgi:hypothetical protein